MSAQDDSPTPPNRVLFAIGTAEYDDPNYQESKEQKGQSDSLSESVPQSLSDVVESFAKSRVEPKLPPPGYLLDPDTRQLRDTFAKAGSAGDIVTVYYTGHGDQLGKDGYYLITKDFTKSQRISTGVKAADLPELLVRRDSDGEIDAEQPPTLLILDCCFSGSGGLEMLRDAVLNGTHPNLWVWATAGPVQYAVSGTFARALSDLLRNPLVGASTEHLPLDTVLDTIDHALEGTDQSARMFSPPGYSRMPRFFPNSGYVRNVAGLTLDTQHWISKARGAADAAAEGFYLTGRTGRVKAAEDLARWITDPKRGQLAVVTGSPGTGKSTLLALPALLSDPATRNALMHGTPVGSIVYATAALLPVNTRVVAIHARGLNTDQVAQEIATRLGRIGTPTMGALLGSLEETPPRQSPVVIVDAVDEATSPVTLRESLLVPLARRYGLRVVLGARRHALPASGTAEMVIDLDTETYRDPEALIDYVRQLLVAAHEPDMPTPYRNGDGEMHSDTGAVATVIADRATSGVAGSDAAVTESFLIARLIALSVRARPGRVDVAGDEWTQQLPTGLVEAFEEDLSRLGALTPAAWILLEALAWARGPGLPWETVWAPVARAVAGLYSRAEIRSHPTDDDVRRLLDRAGAYVIEDLGPGGRSVFRPFHDRLAEYLRDRSGPSGTELRRAAIHAAMTGALLDTIPIGPEGNRCWERAHPYLRTYLAEHAYVAGTKVLSALLDESGFLAVADPATLAPILHHAPPERQGIVRVYRRTLPLLGEDVSANAAYLQEAALAVTGESLGFATSGITPLYRTLWVSVRRDNSLLTLSGHNAAVWAVAFGAGAEKQPVLASGSDDGTVRLWDPESGVAVGEPLTGHTGPVRAVAFGAGAEKQPVLASGSDDGTVRLWDPESGVAVGEPLTGHTGPVRAVAFGTGTDGQPLLATAGDDGTVQLWDPETGAPVDAPVISCDGMIRAMAFRTGTDEPPQLATTAGSDGAVQLWNPETGATVGEPLTGHTRPVEAVAFGTGTDGLPLLATAGDDGTVQLWNPDAGTSIHEMLNAHTVLVRGMAFGTDSEGRALLATASFDGTVALWDPETGAPVGEPLTGHAGSVEAVAFGTGTDGRPLLATAGEDGTVRLWDPDIDYPEIGLVTGHTLSMWALAFGTGSDGRPLLATASASYDGTVQLWDSDTGIPAGDPLTGHTRPVWAMAFGTGTGGRPLLATADFTGTMRLWDPEAGIAVGELLSDQAGSVRTMAFGIGNDGRPLLATASASYDGTVQLWDPEAGIAVGEPLSDQAGPVRTMAFGIGNDGRLLLATAGDDGTVQLWDPETFTSVGEPLTGHTRSVCAMAFGTGRDGRVLLATAGEDGTVQRWNPDTGVPVGEPLTGHTESVLAVAFGVVAEGRRPVLGSASYDGTVRLWDPDTGACLMTIRRRTAIHAMDCVGGRFAIGDADGLSVIEVD